MLEKTKHFILFICVGFIFFKAQVASSQTIGEKLECNKCHRLSSTGDEKNRKAPDLFFAGDKFQKKWLLEFLKQPEVVRPGGFILDPEFLVGAKLQKHKPVSEEAAKHLANFLMSLKLPSASVDKIDDTPLSKGKIAKVKIKFERNYGCTACHQAINLARQPRGGISGPSLVNAGNRLKGNWIYDKLKDPRMFDPQGRMPIFKLPDEEYISLTKYILTLKKENLR